MSDLTGWQIVNAATVHRGDQVNLGGSLRSVADMVALPGNRMRLVFDDGGAYHLDRNEILYAYRPPR